MGELIRKVSVRACLNHLTIAANHATSVKKKAACDYLQAAFQ
jgi:hypothetical protein